MRRFLACGLLAFLCLSSRTPQSATRNSPERFLLVWTGDADRQHQDFLAVVDVRSGTSNYGKVIRTIPVGSRANEPHHMDYSLRPNGELWASGLLTGRTFVFDVSDPPQIRLKRVDQPSRHRIHTPPHSYALLADGRTLATAMDMRQHGDSRHHSTHGDPAPGALLEFDKNGRFVRQIPAADPAAGSRLISPYSLAVAPHLDRLLTTNEGHGYLPDARQFRPGDSVQLWRLSGLTLLKTIPLPAGPRGRENLGPFEPRIAHAAGSETVFVNSDSGNALYVSENLGGAEPVFHLVYDFGRAAGVGVPALVRDDRFYLQPLSRANKVAVLDVRTPRRPRLVTELSFGADPDDAGRARKGGPHYIMLDSANRRAAVSNYTIDVPAITIDGDRRVYLLDFDPATGRIGFDLKFRDEHSGEAGLDFNRESWPHGKTGAARPHALLFLP